MASGQTLLEFFAESARPPATLMATYSTLVGASAPVEALLVLLFDAATIEYTDFEGYLPANYAGGGITCEIEFSMVSDTNNAHQVVVGCAFVRVTGINMGAALNYVFSDGNGTIQSIAKQSKRLAVSISHVSMGSPPAGERFILRVRRNATSGTDDATGDMRFHGIHIKET
jgi:hypothetical protein